MLSLAECFDKQVAAGGYTDKNTSHSYPPFYEDLLQDLRGKPIRFLEIGVRDGSSLRAWREWLGPMATIYGIDNWCEAGYIAPKPTDDFEVQTVDTHKISDVHRFLRSVSCQFDCIIDDGDHEPFAQVATWAMFYPWVRPGGYYICEDIIDISTCHKFHDLFGGSIEDRKHIKQRHDDQLVWFEKGWNTN